ncbi:phenylalanine--tRNA ligase subunit beta [Halosimplex litoreum]|uniref:Phenylalanine--tRNA ligase beta subunit n=1 Tax=Halosimplex litoreum TaxID=1198301 RepID=A0A7U3WAS6_9EURY|nr:phenylalanine--tRNA ligase beta subunit-related protein [Halosimplex litoreum]QPV64721.1 phenylalanine--tRNA ligase subunit beta [Halosimplex litoreum]
MPTVEIDPDELRELTGHDEKSDDELREDMFALGLEYEGETDDGEFELEFAPDRLDRLSVEGVARSLRYQYGDDRGVYVPTTNDADWTIEVDSDVPDERPYVTGAVVRGLDMDEAALESLIQLQEKLHATMGRQRAKGAIGVHDLTMLKGQVGARGGEDTPEEEDDPRTEVAPSGGKSVRYTGIGRRGDRFVPLEENHEMTPQEVLMAHHTANKFADLVDDYESMPAIYDDVGMFSFPPIINGKRTEVTTDSRDLFVEMTGTDQWTIDHMLNIVCYALDARGGRVEEVAVEYTDDASGDYAGNTLVRPNFDTRTKTVDHPAIESMLGVDLDGEEVVDLMQRAGLDAEAEDYDAGEDALAYEVEIPPYRVDVLHPVDVIDDVGRAFGFNELDPKYPDVSTVGGRHERSRLERATRETLVGLGFEDLLNFHLVSEEANYDRIGIERGSAALGGGEPAVIGEPYSEDYEIVRTWALPSVMLVLENNTHRAYPQHLSEVGLAIEQDETQPTLVDERHTVAAAVADHDASYEDAKASLQALCRAFDVDLATPPTDHPTFISGRTADVIIDGRKAGVIGEVHPKVLVEYDLEVPVAAFEFDLDALR